MKQEGSWSFLPRPMENPGNLVRVEEGAGTPPGQEAALNVTEGIRAAGKRERLLHPLKSRVLTLLGFDLVFTEGPQPSDSAACSLVRPKLKDRRWHRPETPSLPLLVGQR